MFQCSSKHEVWADGLGKRKNYLPCCSSFPLDYTVAALFLIIVLSFKIEAESPVGSVQLPTLGVPIPVLSQLLFFLRVGSRKKVTCLLAYIQLCLIDNYTIVKQLFATISVLMKDAVLIVIVTLLSNICTLLKNLKSHMSCYSKINETHVLFTQNWH